jgi:arginyl-tRNA--protein-N-Asp/Glu arginylyltransferase
LAEQTWIFNAEAQVIIEAIKATRMGYTNITHGYKIRDELKPHCEECDQEVTVEHLIWQLAASKKEKKYNQRFNGRQ